MAHVARLSPLYLFMVFGLRWGCSGVAGPLVYDYPILCPILTMLFI